VVQDGGVQPVLYLDAEGGLRYAVAFIADALPGGIAPSAVASMNQRHFMFEPQVLAVRRDQAVRFSSEDSANHNVRARDASAANTFSVNTATGSPGPFVHRFGAAAFNPPVELSCDIHPWMAAWVYVFDHDTFAVTGADGTFHIEGVATGLHPLSVRQPAGGLARDVRIEVMGGERTRINLRFTSADLTRAVP
jgi:plastocyanin